MASAKPEDIDWVTTIILNANPSSEEEREVRVAEGRTVKFIDVYTFQGDEPTEVEGYEHLIGKRLPVS